VCYWGFTIPSKLVVGFLYYGVMSLGIRLSYTEMGVKLSKFIPWFDDYELTYKLDLASIAAILILFTIGTFAN